MKLFWLILLISCPSQISKSLQDQSIKIHKIIACGSNLVSLTVDCCYFYPRCALVTLAPFSGPLIIPEGAVSKSRDMWKVVELVKFMAHGENFRHHSIIPREKIHRICCRKGEYGVSLF